MGWDLLTRQMHSDGKKRRLFLAMRFAAGDQIVE